MKLVANIAFALMTCSWWTFGVASEESEAIWDEAAGDVDTVFQATLATDR